MSTKVYFNGVEVATMRTNNTEGSPTLHYVGQDVGNNRFLVYVWTLGICRVELDKKELEKVHIIEIVKPISIIRAEILKEFENGKKLAVFAEENDGIEIIAIEIPVNTLTIDTVLKALSLNTTNNGVKKHNIAPTKWTTGICVRDCKDSIKLLKSIGKIVMRFSSSAFLDVVEFFDGKATGANNGNFAEYFISGNIKDIEERFRAKKIDVYVKLEEWKSVRRWELKTTLCTVNKAPKSSASNTNTFCKMTFRV